MSNGRHFKRTLSATFLGAAIVASSGAAPLAGAEEADHQGVEGSAAPMLWSGTLTGSTTRAVVTGRIDPITLSDDVDESISSDYENLGAATLGAGGAYVLRASPGPWYQRIKNSDGWVNLTLMAGDGEQFGIGMLHVKWADDGSPGGGHWVAGDDQVDSGGDQDGQGLTSSSGGGQLSSGAPTSSITMSPIPADASGWQHEGAVRSPSSGGYVCYGGRSLINSSNNWITIGKYYSANGPNEGFEYSTSRTSQTGYGFSLAGRYKAFSLSGNISFETQYGDGIYAGADYGADGTNPWGADQVQVMYFLYKLENCFPESQPPSTYGGATMYQLVPHRWTGDARVVRWNAAPPTTYSAYRITINPTAKRGRNNAITTSTSMGGTVDVLGSTLSASASVKTIRTASYELSRHWENKSTTTTKYVEGQNGNPQTSGTFVVRGFS